MRGGLAMLRINPFWKAVRMSWLRRLITSKSTWAKLHKNETFPYTFNPHNSDQEGLTKAKEKTNNYFWKDVYTSLLQCRNNVILKHLEELITLPINGKFQITCNNYPINQAWCKNETLNILLDRNGGFKNLNNFLGPKKPMYFEYLDLKKTLKNFIDSSFGEKRGLEGGWFEKFRLKMGTFNLYGRIVTKKIKGYSYYYQLL